VVRTELLNTPKELPTPFRRYDYINSFILDYIAYSIHVSEVGGFYWYILALQVMGWYNEV
jgi:hypothetical protein